MNMPLAAAWLKKTSAAARPAGKNEPARDQRGFTLLELLIVVIILGLLAALVGPELFGTLEKAKSQVAKTQLEIFAGSLDRFRLDVGRYPSTEEGLQSLRDNVNNLPKWSGPYLKKDIPPDPWGNPYQYLCPGTKGEYDLYSFGADGKPGGEEEDADVWI
jgi:general secretion pathway protein G